jgi:hypothetical protein
MSQAGYATAHAGWPESKTFHSGALTSPRPIVRDLGPPPAVLARTMRADAELNSHVVAAPSCLALKMGGAKGLVSCGNASEQRWFVVE